MTRLALVFHANQTLTYSVSVATRVCYRALLRVLRAHPRVRCTLHLSGTLLHALLWLDPDVLDLVRAGLAEGQFELLGSTYAQNVPYASDDADNRLQMSEHRALLRALFGVEPEGFWNAERCWRQSLVAPIVDGGYRYTLVEEQALRRSGAQDLHRPYRTSGEGRRLEIYPDHEPFKHLWNWAVWAGHVEPVLAELHATGHGTVVYAEDAEAVGLWAHWSGLHPAADWTRLDELLTRVEDEPDVEFTRLGDLARPGPADELTPIAEHQAAWMVNSLRTPGAPYHEEGYEDWFDFNRRSPKNRYFRTLFAQVRECLPADLSPAPAAPAAAERLAGQARLAYCAHQYEFGCIGIGGSGDRNWEQIRTARVPARAAELAQPAQAGRQSAWREDVNADGEEELLLCDGRQLAVLTPLGARLLYWFDLARGEELVGNENAVPAARYVSDAAYPLAHARPRPWVPGDGEDRPVSLAALEGWRRNVAAPGAMGRFVPETVWRAGPPRIDIYVRPEGDAGLPPAAIQQRALNDMVVWGSTRLLDPAQSLRWSSELAERGVTFGCEIGDRLRLRKQISLAGNGLAVDYALSNLTGDDAQVTLEVASELCPAYRQAMDAGRTALRYWTRSPGGEGPTVHVGPGTCGVVNVSAGIRVEIEADQTPMRVSGSDSLFALALGQCWEWSLAAGDTAALAIRLLTRS